ncbi:MAG: FadR family transcriptional regulator [Opitutaceae bacterium]|nr:FadR family transcriptional regulator [Opitutaceae bacterium]
MQTSLRRAPLVTEICDRLLREHRAVEWLPGERTLSARLGVSRSALREAVQRLEIQGLLEVRHGVGVRVINNPQAPVQATLLRELPDFAERLRQFSEVRLLVEPEIARCAAERGSPEDRRRLQEVHARLGDATDVNHAVQADLDFHRTLADMAGNRILALMLGSIAELEEESRRITLMGVGIGAAFSQHERIAQAVVTGDGPSAREAMVEHVTAAGQASR